MQRTSLIRPALSLAIALAAALTFVRPQTIDAQAGASERTLFVSALDTNGNPVPGLQANDFIIREDGVRREVLRVSRANDPIDIALLVDNSTAARDLIVPMREGLKRFITVISSPDAPPHQVAIIGIGTRPTIFAEYTADAALLNVATGRLFAEPMSGMTLLDAIVEASKGMERREAPRAVIAPVITDGTEFNNRYYRDVIAAMKRAGVSFMPVTVGTFPTGQDEDTRNRSFVLAEGPRDTGGREIRLLSAMAVTGALEKLARELISQYKVVYARPESLIPPEKVEVSTGRPGTTVHGTPARGQKASGA
jgi:VWFA-related protein